MEDALTTDLTTQARATPWGPILLELIPGWFQVFGLGHLYQGRIAMGLGIMVSYWLIQAINAALTMVLIGFVTGPLTWLFYMIAAPLNARDDDPKG